MQKEHSAQSEEICLQLLLLYRLPHHLCSAEMRTLEKKELQRYQYKINPKKYIFSNFSKCFIFIKNFFMWYHIFTWIIWKNSVNYSSKRFHLKYLKKSISKLVKILLPAQLPPAPVNNDFQTFVHFHIIKNQFQKYKYLCKRRPYPLELHFKKTNSNIVKKWL